MITFPYTYATIGAMAFAVGFYSNATINKAKLVNEIEAQKQDLVLQHKEERSLLQVRLSKADKALLELNQRLNKQSTREKVIYRDVYKYVKNDADCQYNESVVRLLNKARGYSDESTALNP